MSDLSEHNDETFKLNTSESADSYLLRKNTYLTNLVSNLNSKIDRLERELVQKDIRIENLKIYGYMVQR